MSRRIDTKTRNLSYQVPTEVAPDGWMDGGSCSACSGPVLCDLGVKTDLTDTFSWMKHDETNHTLQFCEI